MFSNLANFFSSNKSHTTQKDAPHDNTVIDLQKTFSSDNIDIIPIIKRILDLEPNFPENILQTKLGQKYMELEFFQSNLDSNVTKNNQTVFDKLNLTQTMLGSHLLQSILLKPLSSNPMDQTLLLNRQKVIKRILNENDPPTKLLELPFVRSNLAELKKIEKDFLAMLLDDTPEMKEVYNVIYFQFKPLQILNYNETFLKLFYYFLIIFSPLYGLISPFVVMFLPFFFMKYIMKLPISFDAFWNITKNMIFGNGVGIFANLGKIFNNNNASSIIEGLINPNGGISVKSVVFWLVKMIVLFMNSTIGSYCYVAFFVISYIYGIYNSFQTSNTFNKIINMFHSRLNIMSRWIKICVNLYESGICRESLEVKEHIIEKGKIDELLNNPIIVELLNNKTFEHEPGWITNKGIIIKVFKQYLDAKEISQVFMKTFSHYLAYVDVFSALGTWLRENNDQTIAKSYCTYNNDSTTPLIKGTDVWNICCEVPVYNDIIMGLDIEPLATETTETTETILTDKNIIETLENVSSNVVVTTNANDTIESDVIVTETENFADKDIEDVLDEIQTNPQENQKPSEPKKIYNNMLITGPNSSGKSTYIKSVIECVLLGQTIGIVPARNFEFTPFKHITTYLNIPDCQGKESLFQAEMNRCYQQLELLEKAESNKEFSFNIMDEIFVSTNYQEGMSGAYAVINQFCKFNNCLNIITTHFDYLANMKELPVARNYFDIEINDNDEIVRDFKVKQGVSKKHLALKLLKKKGFNQNIIHDAEYLYEQLQGKQSQ
jgi:hypothetical protein